MSLLKAGLHNARVSGRPDGCILYGSVYYLWILTTKVASYHYCGALGFRVLLNFWKLCATLLNVKSKIVLVHTMAA
jgi:hypothetical protein